MLIAGVVAAKNDYPFALPADRAFEKVAALDTTVGQSLSLTKDEARLFAAIREGKAGEFTFAETCLIAGGVTDPDKRKVYLTKLDEIEKGARKAIDGAKTPKAKAEQLLKFLHKEAMATGYESGQTDLHGILDTGKYNCVSSAVLYNVIGRRLGLDLRAVEIPEHVFSVLCDGDKRIDVETTNAQGFDPSDATGRKKHSAAERREVGEEGLAAIIAYNHGVTLSQEKHYHEAALANFRALAIDPTNPGAAKNAMADLTNWPLELAKSGDYENALAVMSVGLQLAPTESSLKNNHKVVWSEYADARMKAGKPVEAVAILRRAAKAGTGEDFETRQAYLFVMPAQELMDAGKWDEALKLIDSGMKAVDLKAQKTLRESRVGVFLRWSQEEASKEKFEKALEVLKRGAAEEKDSRIKNNTVVTYDTWANTFMTNGKWDEAIRIYERGLKQLPGDKHLENNLAYCREQMKK
jgi:tetratricopeptide (TPR) repeat protein